MSADILRKMGLFGIGIIALTQERLEEFAQEMIIKGEMNREEGKKFVIEVLSEKDKQLKDIEEKISNKVKEAIENSGIATKKDMQALEKRIGNIEKDITVRYQLNSERSKYEANTENIFRKY